MISARRGPMPVILRRRRQVQLGDLAVELADLRGGDAQAVDLLALASAAARATAPATAEAVADVAIARSHARWPRRRDGAARVFPGCTRCIWCSWRGAGGSSLQEILAQPHGAQRLRKRLAQPPVLGGDDLRAAAADIDDQNAFAGLRPGALHAQVDQAGLFAAGDDFDRRAGGFRRAGQELP